MENAGNPSSQTFQQQIAIVIMSSHQWAIIDTGTSSADNNMAYDALLLEKMATGHLQEPVLHLYEWDAPSATFGHFINPYDLLHADGVKECGLQLARRPTGGGMIFHVTDLAFSIVVPASHPAYSINVLDNYAFVNRLVIKAVKRFTLKRGQPTLLVQEPSSQENSCNFCMAKPTKYDVMLDGRKVGGGAQRRTKHGFLHQGTISLALPNEAFLRNVLKNSETIEAMKAATYALLPCSPSPDELRKAKDTMRDLLIGAVLNSKM